MKLQIFDSNGTELKVGDKVKLQEQRNGMLTFYTTIQVIDGQIFPLNKFCFDRMIKVDKIPTDCKYAQPDIERNFPEYWMHPKMELELIEKDRLDKWRMEICSFEHNSFFRVLP